MRIKLLLYTKDKNEKSQITIACVFVHLSQFFFSFFSKKDKEKRRYCSEYATFRFLKRKKEKIRKIVSRITYRTQK